MEQRPGHNTADRAEGEEVEQNGDHHLGAFHLPGLFVLAFASNSDLRSDPAELPK
jgi:hypothetical protein